MKIGRVIAKTLRTIFNVEKNRPKRFFSNELRSGGTLTESCRFNYFKNIHLFSFAEK